VCDNFGGSVDRALHISQATNAGTTVLMNQELEQEYEKLSKKAHELREYL
jgi:hypothetical protein